MKLKKTVFKSCLLSLAAFCIAKNVMACDCGGVLPPIHADSLKKYDLIFLGKIDSLVKNEQTCIAILDGIQLFKGLAAKNNIRIAYDCFTSCAMPFASGQVWIIYANTTKYGETVKYCSRTRKKPTPGETDVYTIYSGIRYDREFLFLQKTFPAKDFGSPKAIAEAKKEDKRVIDASRYLKYATPIQQVRLILISVIVLVVIIFILKRFGKK